MKILSITATVVGAALLALAMAHQTPAFAIAGLVFAICIGVAILIAAQQGRISVKIDISLNLGLRQPP